MMKVHQIKCFAACRYADGTPGLVPIIVECTKREYNNGDHYDVAEGALRENGYEGNFQVIDENDGLTIGEVDCFKAQNWDNVDKTATPSVQFS